MISGTMVLTVLVKIVIVGLIFWLLWWFLRQTGLPEPFNKVALVILALAAVVFLIDLLMRLNGSPLVRW